MSMRRLLSTSTILLGLGILGAGPARAADVTPEQKTQLEALVRSWYAFAGNPAALGADATKVTPAGDHFDVATPYRMTGSASGEILAQMQAVPGNAGRWHFEKFHVVTPTVIKVEVPVDPKAGQKGGGTETVVYTVNAEKQDGSFDYDPSFSTPMTYQSQFTNMTVVGAGPRMRQDSRIGAAASKSVITPRDARLLDVTTTGELSSYRLVTQGPADKKDDVAIAFEAARIGFDGGANGVDKEQVGKLFRAVAAVGEFSQKAKPGEAVPAAMRQALVDAVKGLASDMRLVETFDTVKVSVGDKVFAVDKGIFGLDGKSADGLIRTTMAIGYDGLKVPDMGMGFEELVPTAVALKPYADKVPAESFARFMAQANGKAGPSAEDMRVLFARGPIEAGLESMSIDMGGARFTGTVKTAITAPNHVSGTARLVAENFDALLQKLQTQPMGQQAVPALVFAKGIGRNDGGKLVWDVVFDGPAVTVNGMDMSAMTGGAPKGPAAPNRTR